MKSAFQRRKPHTAREENARTFVSRCVFGVETVDHASITVPFGEQVKQLEAVANASRLLLTALGKMSKDAQRVFEVHFDYLALSRETPVDISDVSRDWALGTERYEGGMLANVWAVIEDLGAGARYAISKCDLSRGDRVADLRARSLAYWTAQSYRGLFSSLPPAGKETWFVVFMSLLGEIAGCPCGSRAVSRALRDLRQ